MSLNPRLIAIQGFGFTPIALAVQGLIDQIQEEQRQQVYGNGGAKQSAKQVKQAEKPDPRLDVDYIAAQWDLLEQRVKNTREQHGAAVSTLQIAQPNIDSALNEQRRRNDDALILLLLEAA